MMMATNTTDNKLTAVNYAKSNNTKSIHFTCKRNESKKLRHGFRVQIIIHPHPIMLNSQKNLAAESSQKTHQLESSDSFSSTSHRSRPKTTMRVPTGKKIKMATPRSAVGAIGSTNGESRAEDHRAESESMRDVNFGLMNSKLFVFPFVFV